MPAVAIATLIALMLEMASAKGAALAIVLAVDVSASVSADSYILQRDGIAQAFANPRVAQAISTAPGGIEVLVLEWSDPDKIAVTVDWTRLGDAQSAIGFAAAVRASRRSSAGITAIGPALIAAAAAFEHLPEPAAHRIIDIAGDGIAIYGLAILTEEPWLADYFRSDVIGGPSAFVVIARTFDDFAEAMLRKLVQEVADASVSAASSRSAQMQ